MKLFAVAAVVIVCLAAAYALITFLFCLFTINGKPTGLMKRRKRPYEDVMQVVGPEVGWWNQQKKQEIWCDSFDGLKLFAEYLPAENARATVIEMHGYHSNSTGEFAMRYRAYHNAGFNVLLPHQRAHGRSGGRFTTLGVNESKDVALWVGEAEKIAPGLPVILEGVSMGGASVLMASAADLPVQVCGIIDDCGFTSPAAIIAEVARHSFHLPPALFLKPVCLWIRALGRFNPYCSTLDALKTNRLPVLFIHGEEDSFVPYAMGLENYGACRSRKQFLSVPGAKHARSSVVDQKAVLAASLAFIEGCISSAE